MVPSSELVDPATTPILFPPVLAMRIWPNVGSGTETEEFWSPLMCEATVLMVRGDREELLERTEMAFEV